MANAHVRKHIRSLGEIYVSESVYIEQISRIYHKFRVYNKYTLHLDKEKEMYTGILTSPVMGSSSPQTLSFSESADRDDPVDMMGQTLFQKLSLRPFPKDLMKMVCQPEMENHYMNS